MNKTLEEIEQLAEEIGSEIVIDMLYEELASVMQYVQPLVDAQCWPIFLPTEEEGYRVIVHPDWRFELTGETSNGDLFEMTVRRD